MLECENTNKGKVVQKRELKGKGEIVWGRSNVYRESLVKTGRTDVYNGMYLYTFGDVQDTLLTSWNLIIEQTLCHLHCYTWIWKLSVSELWVSHVPVFAMSLGKALTPRWGLYPWCEVPLTISIKPEESKAMFCYLLIQVTKSKLLRSQSLWITHRNLLCELFVCSRHE